MLNGNFLAASLAKTHGRSVTKETFFISYQSVNF
jgi:hypothetical protein